jgi:hypothetical protein
MIDYPNAKEYAFEIFEKLGELKIMNEEMIEKYKKHVEMLKEEEETE